MYDAEFDVFTLIFDNIEGKKPNNIQRFMQNSSCDRVEDAPDSRKTATSTLCPSFLESNSLQLHIRVF